MKRDGGWGCKRCHEFDRAVHARSPLTGAEVVRYDCSGKWYVELRDGTRRKVTLAHAVSAARGEGMEVFPGIPGGGRFYAALRAAGSGTTPQ